MAIKILFLVLFAVSCGPNVKLKENQLENPSLLTSKKSHEMTGTLTKKDPAELKHNGKTYTVSKFSSKDTQNFINAMAAGATVNITFTGGFDKTEAVIETIK